MDEVIEKARKKIAELEAEIAELRTFIDVFERLSEASKESEMDSADGITKPVMNLTQLKRRAKPAEIVSAAKDVMLEKKRPLTRTELVRLLTSRGLHIAGTDKSKNVGTIIWRSKEFDSVEGLGYWPKDAPHWEDYRSAQNSLDYIG